MAGPAANVDRPAVRLRDGERPRQSKSNPFVRFVWVVCPDVEPLEQMGLVFQWDARSVVGHRPADHAIGGAMEANRDAPSIRSEMLGIG